MPVEEQDPLTAQAGGPPPAAPTPGLIKRLYRRERAAWRGHYKRYFKYAARALGLGFVAGFVFFTLWPAQETRALDFVVKALEDIRLEGSPLVLALTLFYHNARASIVAIAAGVVPFFFLPILDPFINGGVLGLLASVGKHQGLDVPGLFLTQVLPHGVFELTAVLYATSLGLYLSAEMGKKAKKGWKKIMGTHTSKCPLSDNSSIPAAPQDEAAPAAPLEFLETYPDRLAAEPTGPARNIVRSFILVVLPLLLVAAAIEGFITPHLR
jgi:stage II sporulation protein M